MVNYGILHRRRTSETALALCIGKGRLGIERRLDCRRHCCQESPSERERLFGKLMFDLESGVKAGLALGGECGVGGEDRG